MKIYSVGYYKDGGSVSLATDMGDFVIDKQFGSETAGQVTLGDINDENRPEAYPSDIHMILAILDVQINDLISGDNLWKEYADLIRSYHDIP